MGGISFNKPGEGEQIPVNFSPNTQMGEMPLPELQGIFQQWARLSQSGEKLNDAQQKLLGNMTDLLFQHGVFSGDKVWNAVTKGTPFNGVSLQDALNGQGINNAGALDVFNSVSSRNENVNQNQATARTSVNYVDLPTPEEFLDDFQNMYQVHLTGLAQSGAIRPEVAAFARSMVPEMFSQYTRQRITDLLAGKPLFKVVGTNAQNKLIGSRTGAQESSGSVGTETQQGQYNQSSSGGGGGSQYDAQGNYVGGSGAGQVSETYNNKTNTVANNRLNETEALVQRNKLGAVASLSPLDFLKDKLSAQSLNLLYAGQKGTAARERQTSAGGESFATRRI